MYNNFANPDEDDLNATLWLRSIYVLCYKISFEYDILKKYYFIGLSFTLASSTITIILDLLHALYT